MKFFQKPITPSYLYMRSITYPEPTYYDIILVPTSDIYSCLLILSRGLISREERVQLIYLYNVL